jgi:hypothetical protein
LLAASASELFEFVEPPDPTRRGSWKPAPIGLANFGAPHCLLVDSEGALWIGTEHGLIKYKGGKAVIYDTSNGLTDNFIHSLDLDLDRNLCIGTNAGGLCMLSAEPVMGLGRSDGLPDAPITKLFEDRDGHVYVGAGYYHQYRFLSFAQCLCQAASPFKVGDRKQGVAGQHNLTSRAEFDPPLRTDNMPRHWEAAWGKLPQLASHAASCISLLASQRQGGWQAENRILLPAEPAMEELQNGRHWRPPRGPFQEGIRQLSIGGRS